MCRTSDAGAPPTGRRASRPMRSSSTLWSSANVYVAAEGRVFRSRTAAGVGPAGRRSTPASTCWRSIRSGPRSSTRAPEPACSRASTPGEAGHGPGSGRRQGSLGASAARAMSSRSWSTPPTAGVVYAVAGTAAAPFSKVSKSVDGGRTWRTLPASPSLVSALTIDPTNPQVLFATVAGAWTGGKGHSSIAMTSDGGVTWRTVLSRDGYLWAIAVDPASPATVYAVGDAGVLVTDDGGLTWQSAGTAPADNLTGLALDPHSPGTLYVSSWKNGVFRTTDGGRTWSALGTTLGAPIAIDSQAPSTLYVGAADRDREDPRQREDMAPGRLGHRRVGRPLDRDRPPRQQGRVRGNRPWPVPQRRPRSHLEGARARSQRPGGSRGSCEHRASARQRVTRDPHQHEQGPNLGEGSRQHERQGPRRRDRVRPTVTRAPCSQPDGEPA